MRRLLFDKGTLHRMQALAIAKAFQGHDRPAGHAERRDHAGARRHAVDQHGTGAAFAQAAAVFRAVERQIVAQYQQERRIRHHLRMKLFAVHRQHQRMLRQRGFCAFLGDCTSDIAIVRVSACT